MDANWATAPFEAQYLKLYDVTAPTGTPGPGNPPNVYAYVVGNTATLQLDGCSSRQRRRRPNL